MDLEDRIAVVTGGASGIGRELVLQLVTQGAHVAVCDVDRKRLDATARRARALSPQVRVSTHLADVTDEASVDRLVAEVAHAHVSEAIHVLFNNAGIVGGGSFVAGPREEWERTFAVSWFGVYHCTRAFLPMLLAADRGAVVNTASVNALWASLGPVVDGARMMAAILTTLGVTAAATRLSDAVPFWFPSTALVLVMIVAGVDRVESRPERWAFLLRDTPDIAPDEIVAPLVILMVGAALLITRPVRAWDE